MRRPSPSVFISAAACRGHPADGVDRSSQRTGPGDPRTVHARASRHGGEGLRAEVRELSRSSGSTMDRRTRWRGRNSSTYGPPRAARSTELYFITRTTMPKNEAALTTAEYVAVLAYLLERNGLTPGDRELTADPAPRRAPVDASTTERTREQCRRRSRPRRHSSLAPADRHPVAPARPMRPSSVPARAATG